ncbi:MAG: CBO0543 family protein [Syntrophomonas sp.]
MFEDFFRGFKVPYKLYWDSSYEKILGTQRILTDLNIQNWFQYSFPRWTWWFLLFWTITPLFVWWKYTDRRRFLEISFFGLLVSLTAGILDSVGVQLLLWTYPNGLVPALPNFFPIDYVAIPVVFMLIYQKYGGWKEFIVASLLLSAILSMILDPVIVWLNVYQPLSWQYYYSVPTFAVMVTFCKWVTDIVTGRDLGYRGDGSGKKAA